MVKAVSTKVTTFKLCVPSAKKVFLAGSFNNWDTKDLPVKKGLKGNWSVKVDLKPGKYEYKFFVDGAWVNDPGCSSCVANSFGTQNCFVEVK